MIIVSGAVWVDEAARDAYLRDCVPVVEAARAAEGCVDFHLSADPLELDRINVYEEWTSIEAVAAFRGNGPSAPQASLIRDARVTQYEVGSATRL